MRSTRKLTELLGTTPVFSPDSQSTLHRQRSKGKALPRPLVLTLASVPASLSPPKLPPVPLSPTRLANVHVSPASPRRQTISHDDRLLQARRRRMAKLQRTLGENIPPELVLDAPQKRPSRPRSSSVDGAALAATFKIQVIEPSAPQSKIHKISSTPTHSPSLSTSSSLFSEQSSAKKLGRRSSLVGMEGLHLEQVELARKSSDTVRSNDSTSSSEYRKQAGWSGEWNKDMTHVLAQLRELKA